MFVFKGFLKKQFLKKSWNKYIPDLEIYTDKIAENGRRVIRKAYDEARERNHNQLSSEHIFFVIAEVEESFFIELMRSINLDPQAVFNAFDNQLGSGDYAGSGIKMSESFRVLQKLAWKNARSHNRHLIETGDFFIALFQDEEGFPCKFFQQLGVSREIIIQRIQDHEHLIGIDNGESQTK